MSATSSWEMVQLGDLCSLVNGNAYRESDWSGAGLPIIRIQNLNSSAKPFNYWAGPTDGRVLIKTGDVLLAWSGTPGTSFGAHLWDRGPGVLNQHIFRVDIDSSRLDANWAVFAINHQLEHLIRQAHGGVGLRHVTKSEVEDLRIPLPALSEQKSIAAMLNEQMNAIESCRHAISTQASKANGLFVIRLKETFSAITSSTGEFKRLTEIAALRPSRSVAADGDVEVEVVTTASLTETGFNNRGIKLARMRAKDVAECVLKPGEVLIARSNTPELVGRAAMFPGSERKIVAGDLTIRIEAGPRLLPEFLAGYLSYLYVTKYWTERAGGASGTMKKITRTQIEALEVPVPLLEVQERAMSKLRAISEIAMQALGAVSQCSDAAAALPAAYVRCAFARAV